MEENIGRMEQEGQEIRRKIGEKEREVLEY